METSSPFPFLTLPIATQSHNTTVIMYLSWVPSLELNFSEQGELIRYRNWLRTGRPSGRSSCPGRGKIFLLFTLSISALKTTQAPIQWVPVDISPGIKRLGREADHSPPTSAEVKKKCNYVPHTPSWRSA
jgi:hypothetical protein